jgi:DNA-binding transcriptional LysR family regulator
MSQPAMSNALKRLRYIFKDPLLVRTAVGMQPTLRAQGLFEQTRQILGEIENIFDNETVFERRTSCRKFKIHLSDLVSSMLLPGLLDQMSADAPLIGLDVRNVPPEKIIDILESGELDLAVSTTLTPPRSVQSKVLFKDDVVCIMRKDHPLANCSLTVESFVKQRQLGVLPVDTDSRFVDEVLLRLRLKRDIAVNVTNWLIIPHVLARTNLIAVVPDRLASVVVDKNLIVRELPFYSEPLTFSLYWHRRNNANRAIGWLRQSIETTCSRLYGESVHCRLTEMDDGAHFHLRA